MLRLLVLLVLLVAVLAAGAGIATERIVLPEETCPFGSKGSTRGTTSSCKPRPAPTREQITAARDGSALRRALAGLREAGYGDAPLAGVGINAWGETTFMLPTWSTQVGDARYRQLTFDARGGIPPQSKSASRGYVADTGSQTFTAREIDPRDLARAVRSQRGARLVRASFAPDERGSGWAITVRTGDRSRDITLARGKARSGLPAFVALSRAELADRSSCMQRAGTNPLELQKCLTGD